MQNFEETPQITTKVAHKNTTVEVLKGGGKGVKNVRKKKKEKWRSLKLSEDSRL